MMGRRNQDQGQLFYSFDLDEVVPGDHLVREIAAVIDLSWVHSELAPHYPPIGRPSIDPVLMIRMLIVGYVFAIRSERALCREVQVNLAYRWFCGLSNAPDDRPVPPNPNRTNRTVALGLDCADPSSLAPAESSRNDDGITVRVDRQPISATISAHRDSSAEATR